MGCLRIELITIGDELLLGFTLDSNAAHLGRALGAEGVEIIYRTTVGDAPDDIARAVGNALERADGVITTGGLGPTSDDLTKPAIARLFGRSMRFDPDVYQALEQRWKARWPGAMPAANRQQAEIPEGATILTNRHGSAPGIWLEDSRGRWVAMLPGVPREMRGMLTDELLPRLHGRLGTGGAEQRTVVRSRTLRTTGIGESALADRLGELGAGIDSLSLAYLPGPDGVDLRLTARGLSAPAADARLNQAMARLRERVNGFAYGEDDADLARIVIDGCRRRHLHLAVAESCTGGVLGARITAIPGASDVFLGGVIAYDNRVKETLLDVRANDLATAGAVSEPVARQMAIGVRTRTRADIGVAITGVAGPDGGTPDKPVGTVWLALAGPSPELASVTARRSVFVGDRDEIRRRAAQGALDMVRRTLGA